MQRRKRERDDGGLNVSITAPQLLRPPVLPHRVVPTLLHRTVACYLPVVINAPEDPADVDAKTAEILGDIVASSVQCRNAQERQPGVLADLLRSVLVPKLQCALDEGARTPECGRVDGAIIDTTGDDKDTDSNSDSDDVWSDDLWTESPGVDCLEMEPSKVELARVLLPASIRYERWIQECTQRSTDPLRESFELSVAIEGMRVVAVASISKDGFDANVADGEHFFAVGPVDELFENTNNWCRPTWRNATFSATSELKFDETTSETKTRAYGSLEAAGSAARALLFPKSPLRVFTDRELGFLVALAVTVEEPGQWRLNQGCTLDYTAVAAPGLIRDVLYRKKVWPS